MADLSQEEWREGYHKDTNAVIIDVRTEEEMEDGYIPGAINLDIYKGQEFLDEVKKLDKSKAYYVYCRSGSRSAQACALMEQLGIIQAFNLVGGYIEWDGEKELQ